MNYEQNENMVIPKRFKSLTCQATLCRYYKRRATCIADYIEIDDHGICIQFDRKVDESISPKTDSRHNKSLDAEPKAEPKDLSGRKLV